MSSGVWMVITVVIARSRRIRSTSLIMLRRRPGSRAANGSSRRSRGFSVTSARASATRCRCPPDISPGLRSARSRRSTESRAAVTRPWSALDSRSEGRTPSPTFSRAVRWANKLWSWNNIATGRSAGESGRRFRPSKARVPPTGVSNPAIMWSSVVLPPPEGPTTAHSAPDGTSSEYLAEKSGYSSRHPSTRSIGPPGGRVGEGQCDHDEDEADRGGLVEPIGAEPLVEQIGQGAKLAAAEQRDHAEVAERQGGAHRRGRSEGPPKQRPVDDRQSRCPFQSDQIRQAPVALACDHHGGLADLIGLEGATRLSIVDW